MLLLFTRNIPRKKQPPLNKAAVSANPPDLPVFLPQSCRRARKNYVSSVSSAEGAIMISTQCSNAYGYSAGKRLQNMSSRTSIR